MGEVRWPTRRQLGWIAGASVAISTVVAVWLVFALREPFSSVTETMDVTTGEAVQISTDAGYTYTPPAQVTATFPRAIEVKLIELCTVDGHRVT